MDLLSKEKERHFKIISVVFFLLIDVTSSRATSPAAIQCPQENWARTKVLYLACGLPMHRVNLLSSFLSQQFSVFSVQGFLVVCHVVFVLRDCFHHLRTMEDRIKFIMLIKFQYDI